MKATDILYLSELYGLSAEATQAFLDASGAWSEEPTITQVLSIDPMSTTLPARDLPDRGLPVSAASPQLFPLEDLGPLGKGGMGEVRRVRDPNLDRVIAQKIARPGLQQDASLIERFLCEARIAAQLQHPGIVPVHALGYVPDGRPYFTMREVHGPTLSTAIRDVHAASTSGRWGTAPSGWTMRRLLDAFLRACETIAYAHAQGVVHRDIKPDNIMLGRYGEVLVLDWGLARVLLPGDADAPDMVAGTPAYMPPEQAAGAFDRVGPTADVYALGSVLYEILCGRAPYSGEDADDIIAELLEGPPLPPSKARRRDAPPIPSELEELCLRAMAREPEDRPADATAIAAGVADWVEGVRRRERALEIVSRGDELTPRVEALRFKAAALRLEASRLLEPLPARAPTSAREPAWALEDEASRMDREAHLLELEVIQLWGAALTTEPDLPEAHERLAEHYRRQHTDAESRRDSTAAEGFALQIRAHDPQGRHAAYLRGDGMLTLLTDPPGAEVTLYRYSCQARRLVPQPVRMLGRTPIRDLILPMDSYLLEIRAQGRATVHYPALLRRLEHWDGRPPGRRDAEPILLPLAGALGPDERYVAAGPFLHGPDDPAQGTPTPCWVDAFVIRRFPVTNAEYLEFLNDLVRRGEVEVALAAAPRNRGGNPNVPGPLLYRRRPDGHFELGVDAEGHAWKPGWPVVNVDWHGARAYAAWEAARTGLPWRLPLELEWEKAARGVDGREYPWGDFVDPGFCCMLDSQEGTRLPSDVQAWPLDESPYGVRGMAGNVRDWCLDAFRPEGAAIHNGRAAPPEVGTDLSVMRILRGGSWLATAEKIRAGRRYSASPLTRKETIGLRLVRGLSRRRAG